jgi:uncharacterized protein YpmB
MKITNIIGLFIVAVSIIFGWVAVHLFTSINEPIQISEIEALSYLKASAELEEVKQVNFYNGTESYQIFEAINQDEEPVLIWVPNSLDDLIVRQKKTGLAMEEVILFVEKELKPKEIISIKLGMENLIPLYEIIYKDERDHYSYHYISFKDGTYLKHYHLNM